jgi:hypothetical protein
MLSHFSLTHMLGRLNKLRKEEHRMGRLKASGALNWIPKWLKVNESGFKPTNIDPQSSSALSKVRRVRVRVELEAFFNNSDSPNLSFKSCRESRILQL